MTDDMDCNREDVHIDVRIEYELRYWSKALRVSQGELKSAVASVGPVIKHVRHHLQHRAQLQSSDAGFVKET